jgi:hypothetical protein
MLPVPMRMEGETGLDPAASCVTGRRSNQLNNAPAWDTLLLCLLIPPDSLSCPPVPAVPSDRAVTVSGIQVLSTTWKSTDGTVPHGKYIIEQRYCVSRCVSQVNYFFSL